MTSARAPMLAAAISIAAAGGMGSAQHVARDKERRMAAEIWNATDDQLKTAQAKITYLGEQEKPIPTIVFAVEGHTVSMVRFLSVQRSKKPYVNDELPYTKTFAVTLPEFRGILASVKPIATGAAPDKQEFLSFSVLAGAGNAIVGQEFLISRSQGKQFLEAVERSISPLNSTAQETLKAQIKNLYP